MSEHLQNYRLKMVSYLWTILTTVAVCCVFVCVSREHGGCVSYPDLARALGPQKAWGFSWNRVRWRLRDWGLASSLTVKQASRLQNTHTHTHTHDPAQRRWGNTPRLHTCWTLTLWSSWRVSEKPFGPGLTWAPWRGSWRRGSSPTASPSSQDWPSPATDDQSQVWVSKNDAWCDSEEQFFKLIQGKYRPSDSARTPGGSGLSKIALVIFFFGRK